MQPLREQMAALGYRMTPGLEAQVLGALATKPCAGSFLTGPAGAGKTFLAEAVAQVRECNTFFFQAFPGCRKEELFQTFLPDAAQTSGFRLLEGVLPQAARASQDGPTALILDEWDKTHPSTDAFLLDFLQTGRISIPGSRIRARQEQLLVFITLNDERELSEPLLRRMPMIELRPPPLELVGEALRDTHAGHPYMGATLALYQRAQLVELTKPVTIQELRQLLDAITQLGSRGDWNQLVYQFVTKNWDDHEMLKSAEELPINADFHGLGRTRAVLNPGAYEEGAVVAGETRDAMPRMPRVQRDWLAQLPSTDAALPADQVFGIVPRSDSGYDSVARAVLARDEADGIENPARLPVAHVGEAEIVVFKALDFTRPEQWALILKDGGELLLEARHEGELTQGMLQKFRQGTLQQAPEDPQRCRIYSMTRDELLMRYRGLRIRWTPRTLEVVTHDLQGTRELWDYLYGEQGAITANRRAMQRMEQARQPRNEIPPNEQLLEDYLHVLRDYRHLREWFRLLLRRNLTVWERVTCNFNGHLVHNSRLLAQDFDPDNESPASRAEAQAAVVYNTHAQAAREYYESYRTHIETELTRFVAKTGELPPAVEEWGIFGRHELHSDLEQIKAEGLKLFRRDTRGDA